LNSKPSGAPIIPATGEHTGVSCATITARSVATAIPAEPH
jgi:hypothetical protein